MTTKKDYDKYRAAVLDEMAKSEKDIDNSVRKYLMAIITVCMGSNKDDFTFSKNKSVDIKVDKLLDQLSNSIYNSISQRSKIAISNAFDKSSKRFRSDIFIAFMGAKIGDKTISERIDVYIDNFKTEIESYIAIGLKNGYSATKIFTLWLSNKKKPYDNLLIKKNINNFTAKGLSGKENIGSGYSASSFMGLKDLEMNNTFQAYNYALNKIWEDESNITGWYTIRGSNYPCEECDSHVGEFQCKLKRI